MGQLRFLTAGESHGEKLAVIIEGLPSGLAIDTERVDAELRRRQRGYGRGPRAATIEKDAVKITAGLRRGRTIGAPLLLEVPNADWRTSSAAAVGDEPLRRPRPGHADLAGAQKYGLADLRDVLERASARTTVARVAAGAVFRILLAQVGVEIASFVTRIGGVALRIRDEDRESLRVLARQAKDDDVMCPERATADAMRARIDEARVQGDTVGGAFCVVAMGAPPGLGSYVEWDRRLDGRLAQAILSIPAVKAVEIGIGVEAANVLGSEAHDEIAYADGDDRQRLVRLTNRSGGLEGGMTNGEDIVVRATMKPIATLLRPLSSVDLDRRVAESAAYERSDVCAVPACAVIAESAVAHCLAYAALESYGADTIADFVASFRQAQERHRHP